MKIVILLLTIVIPALSKAQTPVTRDSIHCFVPGYVKTFFGLDIWALEYYSYGMMTEKGTGRVELRINPSGISEQPLPVKKILACYSNFFNSDLLSHEKSRELANALGFKTMKQAREVLLSDWNYKAVPYYSPDNEMTIRQTQEGIFVGKYDDEFRVNNAGEIIYIPKPLVEIPYDKELIREKYDRHKIILDGTEIFPGNYFSQELRIDHLFLDPINVESVMVYDRTRTISIERKNKSVSFFNFSEVNISHLNIRRKKKVLANCYMETEGLDYRLYPGVSIIEASVVESAESSSREIFRKGRRSKTGILIKLKLKPECL